MIYTLTLNPAVDRELTVAAIEFDTVLRAREWRVDYGGKGFNVSRMLAALGAASTAVAFAGGRAGELLQDGLGSLGIPSEFVWVPGETRTNVSIITVAHDRYIKVNEPGPTIGREDQRAMIDRVQALARPGDWWVLAGSLPPGLPADFYAALIEILQAAHAKTLLDTSGAALAQGCPARPFFLKPNAVELAALTGLPVDTPAQIAAAATAAHVLGPEHVVVSLGKMGALFAEAGRYWLASPPAISEANPIGAGDSMVGGLVWALSQGESLPEAMRWGLACGAATASQPGTTVGTRAQVESLLAQVRFSPLPVS